MKLKLVLLTIFSLFLLFSATVVEANRNCGTMDRLEVLKQEDPNLEARMQQVEAHTRKFMNSESADKAAGVITIPVVVHVLYRTNAENVSDAQIQSQIDVLNEDFRRTNADRNNAWGQAADTEIEFCLATVDPDGNTTNGITRKSTGKRSWRTNDDMKKSNKGGVDPWDPSSYMNMWVCNLSNGILGYAQFPGGNPATDGIVILSSAFGRYGSAQAPFNLGRTATHEVGHYLNLRHIWGDGACSVDDFVSDTPTSDGANYGCASGHVSCGSTDMVENYMDYSDDGCMNLYTAGQSTRMRALFSAGGARAGLASSNGCSGSGGGGGGEPTASCDDGLQNGDETGVDCGGSCDPCGSSSSCDDGLQNGDETGVDCGGSCDPCAPTGSCDAPSGLASSPRKGGREATLSWNAVGAATSYTVRLRQAGASSWSEGTASATQINATGLTKGATYEWGVSSNCGGSSSGFTYSTFVAGSSGRTSGEIFDQASLDINVYPNPASVNATIELDAEQAVSVQVFDVTGRLVWSATQEYDAFDNTLQLDLSDWQDGAYFVKVNDGEETVVRKLMVVK